MDKNEPDTTPAPRKPADTATAPAPSPDESEFARQAEKAFPLPTFPPLLTVVNDWKKVPWNAYPETVTIRVRLEYDVLRDGEVVGRGELMPGSEVQPVELAGSTLKISTLGAMPTHASIDVEQTDFKERVTANYEESVRRKTEAVLAKRAAGRDRLAAAAAHEKKMRTYNEGDDPRFDAVRESLRRGDAGFYQLDAASRWRWAGKETIGGTDYDVVYVMMASESAFGVIQRELKVLLRDDQVVKWIDVKSGQEL